MKIYTRNGDSGFTSLFGGSKVSKTDPRIEAYGHCDELNSLLGWVLVEIRKTGKLDEMIPVFTKIQSTLFTAGSRLATDNAEMRKKLANISKEDVEDLEVQIDEMTEPLPELKNFVLPGGTEIAARIHMARTMSRRLERAVLEFYQDNNESDEVIMAYLNRISDFLFVAARFANYKLGQEDILWVST